MEAVCAARSVRRKRPTLEFTHALSVEHRAMKVQSSAMQARAGLPT